MYYLFFVCLLPFTEFLLCSSHYVLSTHLSSAMTSEEDDIIVISYKEELNPNNGQMFRLHRTKGVIGLGN